MGSVHSGQIHRRLNYPQVLLIYGMSIFSRSLFHLFWVNFMTLSGMIRMGRSTGFVRPLNAMFQVLSGYLDRRLGRTCHRHHPGVDIVKYVGQRTAGNILWVLLSVISGSLIFASMHIVGNSMAFFTVESSGFSRLALTVDEFTRYPADIYGKGIRTLITWVIPVAFASFYPAQLIFGNGRLVRFALATPFVAALTFMAAYAFWTRAMNRYQGVGN